MKSMGFMKSTKENEKRIALLPEDIVSIKNSEQLFFEKGYGEELGYTDADYIKQGANILPKEKVIIKDIICDPKIGDADYLLALREHQTIFGYIHAVQNRDLADLLVSKYITAIAWEEMCADGRHVFWRNNELAGEAAIMHAFTIYGKMPYDCKVAIIGNGNVARGASRILSSLGAEIVVYNRRMESLFINEIADYDVIVNCVLWDTDRQDHVIYYEDLKRMKKSAIIIDISCDKSGYIESSIPTTISDPVYYSEGILHYVSDHTPTILFRTASKVFSHEVAKYADDMIEDSNGNNETIKNATIIKDGVIVSRNQVANLLTGIV